MMRIVESSWVAVVVLIGASALPACGGQGEPADSPAPGAESVAEGTPPKTAEPEPAPEPAKPARTVLKGQGQIVGDAGAVREVEVELSYGDDKVVEGQLRVGETARQIGGVVDGDRLRCWLSGGDEGGAVQRGMLNGEARAGGGFAGRFAISNNGAVEALSGSWEAAPAE